MQTDTQMSNGWIHVCQICWGWFKLDFSRGSLWVLPVASDLLSISCLTHCLSLAFGCSRQHHSYQTQGAIWRAWTSGWVSISQVWSMRSVGCNNTMQRHFISPAILSASLCNFDLSSARTRSRRGWWLCNQLLHWRQTVLPESGLNGKLGRWWMEGWMP